MRRISVLAAAVMLMAAGRSPATIYVGAPTSGAIVYGPADMLCDMNKCRMFNLPKTDGLPLNTIVEFGVPEMDGQGRLDMRRCSQQMCRASVLGYPSRRTSLPGHTEPTVFITPIELRLE